MHKTFYPLFQMLSTALPITLNLTCCTGLTTPNLTSPMPSSNIIQPTNTALTGSTPFQQGEDAKVYFDRGMNYINKGDFERAIIEFDKALQLNPNDAKAYNSRGLALFHTDDINRAITDYNKALQLDPDFAEAYMNRGNAYSQQGDLERAITDYGKALQLDPNYTDAYFFRGIVYAEKGEKDKAIVDLQKVLELSNDPKLRQDAQDLLSQLGVE